MNSFTLIENIPFKNLTTFKIGGKARYLAEVRNREELVEAVNFAKKKKLPIFVLGSGSDILISDKKFRGLVIKYLGKNITFKVEKENVYITSGAGVIWDDLVKTAVDKNLQGIECMSGIPGTMGASPIQNIGAYGQELKDVFEKATVYDVKRREFRAFSKKECNFSYRESIFKKPINKGRYIIVDITLKLKRNGLAEITYESLKSYLSQKKIKNPTLKNVRSAVLELRGQKHDDPKIIGNAGSFFKNPIVDTKTLKRLTSKYPDIPFHRADYKSVKLFAGWLIEKTGWRGKKYKNTRVSAKNALVITNPEGKASAKEIKQLADKISGDVYKKFGVRLVPEVQYIGFE